MGALTYQVCSYFFLFETLNLFLKQHLLPCFPCCIYKWKCSTPDSRWCWTFSSRLWTGTFSMAKGLRSRSLFFSSVLMLLDLCRERWPQNAGSCSCYLLQDLRRGKFPLCIFLKCLPWGGWKAIAQRSGAANQVSWPSDSCPLPSLLVITSKRCSKQSPARELA